jgi:hypothetical protein
MIVNVESILVIKIEDSQNSRKYRFLPPIVVGIFPTKMSRDHPLEHASARWREETKKSKLHSQPRVRDLGERIVALAIFLL